MVKFTKVSSLSGKEHTREIGIDEQEFNKAYLQFTSGVLIQDAFPTLNSDDREFILSGITPEEWDECVGPEREDD